MRAFVIVTALVVAIIAIGVGLVGGLVYAAPQTHAYGTAPFHFSAAFPDYLGGRVRVIELRARPNATGMPVFVDFDLFSDDYWASVDWARQDTAVGAKLLRTVTDGLLTGYHTRTFYGQGVITTLATSACGIRSVGLPEGACFDVEIVRAGDVTWLVRAASTPDSPQLAQDFVRSFHPILTASTASGS